MPLRFGFLAVLVGTYLLGAWLNNGQHAQLASWLVPALMVLVFLALVAAMYLRVLPAVLALPVLAIALASIAGMKWQSIFTDVVEGGGMRLKTAILAAILGSILAQVVEKTGIAQTAIKKTAELGGDRPILLAGLLTLVIAVLFTTLGGLGAVIMVATIVIPIMLSLGLRPLYVGCLFLLAMSLGGAFNLTNWELFKTTLTLADGSHLTNAQIGMFAWPFAGLMLFTTLVFMLIEGKRMGKARFKAALDDTPVHHEFVPWYALLTPIIPLVPVLIFVLLPKVYSRPAEVKASFTNLPPAAIVQIQNFKVPRSIGNGETMRLPFLGSRVAVVVPGIAPMFADVVNKPWTQNDVAVNYDAAAGTYALKVTQESTTYDFPISVALLLGIIYGGITTWKKGKSTVQLLTKSAFDGVAAVGPALVLMLGIGMVLIATMSPEVTKVIQPPLQFLLKNYIVPHGSVARAVVGFVAFFTLLAPLALYRGPLNLWGMGSGLIGALNGLMPAGAIMGAFMSVGMIQGVCDPTNTHNVWVANYTNTDVQDILKRTLPYMWVLTVAGLILCSVLYYGGVVK